MQPTNDYYGGGVQPQFGNKRPSSRRRLLLIVGGVLLLLTIAMGIYAASSGSGTNAGETNKLLSLVADGNGAKSYELFSPQGKSAIGREEWVAEVVKMKPLLENKKIERAYSEEIAEGKTETGYNAGEKGSIYRFTIIHDTKTGLVESLRYNLTTL